MRSAGNLQVTTNKDYIKQKEISWKLTFKILKKKKKSENIKAIIVEITANLLLQKRISITNNHHESEMHTRERERERERERGASVLVSCNILCWLKLYRR
jgi:hypothetical protein